MVEPLFPLFQGEAPKSKLLLSQVSLGNTPAADSTPGDFPAQRTEALDAFADALRG